MKNLTPTPSEWKDISEELETQVELLVDTMKHASNFVVEIIFRDDVLPLVEQHWSEISAQTLQEIIQTLNKAIVLNNKPSLKALIIEPLIKELNEKERVIRNSIAIDSIITAFHAKNTQVHTTQPWTVSVQNTPSADELSSQLSNEIATTLDNWKQEETIWWPDISTLDMQNESKIDRETALKDISNAKILSFTRKLHTWITSNPAFHEIRTITLQIGKWSEYDYKRFMLWEKIASLRPEKVHSSIITFLLTSFKKRNLLIEPSCKKFAFESLYLRSNNDTNSKVAILLQNFVKEHITSEEELWSYIKALAIKNKFTKNRKRLDTALYFISSLGFMKRDELREKFEDLN